MYCKVVKYISNYQGGYDLRRYQKEIGENMYRKNEKNNYSETTVDKYLSDKTPIISVSAEIETQYKWSERKRTEEVTGYKLFFVQEGVNPFAVKFAEKPKLPKFLSEVLLEKLEAIEIRSKVYFRAESVVEKK